jgi:hypothetical protein
VKSCEMRSWFWNKGDQSFNKLHGCKVNGRRAVVPWLFEFQLNATVLYFSHPGKWQR